MAPVSLGTAALTARQEAEEPVSNPPHPTPAFPVAAVGLVEGVTGSQAEYILWRLTCRHPRGCTCARAYAREFARMYVCASLHVCAGL